MEVIKKDALRELVYEKIKEMILDGILLPGQRISKKELSETIGVSQTPIGEAINRLIGEGLIEQKNREGFFIKVFTAKDLKELFAVRAGLEGIAVQLCIEQGTEEEIEKLSSCFSDFSLPMDEPEIKRYLKEDQRFHGMIIAFSKNEVIISFNNNFDFIMKTYQRGLIRYPEETLEEHKAITAAIKARKAGEAQRLLIEHHMRSRAVIEEKHLKSFISSKGDTA